MIAMVQFQVSTCTCKKENTLISVFQSVIFVFGMLVGLKRFFFLPPYVKKLKALVLLLFL